MIVPFQFLIALGIQELNPLIWFTFGIQATLETSLLHTELSYENRIYVNVKFSTLHFFLVRSIYKVCSQSMLNCEH